MDLSASILSSPAKSRLVRALSYSERPISLNQLSTVIGMNIHAIDEAAKALQKEKILKRKKKANMALFSLNPNHLVFKEIREIAAILEKGIQKSSKPRRDLISVIKWNDDLVTSFINSKSR